MADPHAWQSVANVATFYVPNIVTALCAADAGDCDAYKANAAAYSAKLTALDAEVKSEIAEIPEARRKVITTHDAFGYFGREYGVQFLAPIAVGFVASSYGTAGALAVPLVLALATAAWVWTLPETRLRDLTALAG